MDSKRRTVLAGLATATVAGGATATAQAASTAPPTGLGMPRRELEREVSWLLRTIPSDPQQLARKLANVMVTLIEKNNQRLAEQLLTSPTPTPPPDEDF